MNHIESGDQFPFLQGLIHGGKLLEARIDARLAAFGLSSAKWNALRHLAVNAGGLPLSELAVHLACVKSNVTQLVDQLAADGLVQRVPDPVDRRSVRAELTATGRARYADGLRVISGLGAAAPVGVHRSRAAAGGPRAGLPRKRGGGSDLSPCLPSSSYVYGTYMSY